MSLGALKIVYSSSLIISLISICVIDVSSGTSFFSNDIFDDITDPVTVRVRARSPKTSKPITATDSPIFNDVTGPIEPLIASTIRSNTRTVTPPAVSTSTAASTTSTTTAATTTTTTTTTAAPRTAGASSTTVAASTTGKPTTAKPSVRIAASTTVSTTTKATPVRRLATHPPWPGESSSKSRATHAPWNPEELHRPRGSSKYNRNRATHAPWSSEGGMNHYGDTSGGGFGYSSSQSEHLFPTKSNYAPYVYGSDAKKKSILSRLDRESINSWAKDFISYITNPLSLVSGTTGSTSSSSESNESLFGRVLKTLKAALNKRSGEERNGGVDELSSDNLLFKLKNASWIKRLQGAAASSSSSSSSHTAYNKNDKRFRDVALTTLVDYLRFKRHRTQVTDVKADAKASPCTSNQCHT